MGIKAKNMPEIYTQKEVKSLKIHFRLLRNDIIHVLRVFREAGGVSGVRQLQLFQELVVGEISVKEI